MNDKATIIDSLQKVLCTSTTPASDGRVAKPMAAGYSIEDLASEYKQDGDKVKKLDKDTYVVSRGTDFTVFGKPTSPQYAEFWDLVSQGGNARQKASALAKSMLK